MLRETHLKIWIYIYILYTHLMAYGSKYLLGNCVGYDSRGQVPSQKVFGSTMIDIDIDA